jgi:hypothetical protein
MYKVIYELNNLEFKVLEVKTIKNSAWVDYESEEVKSKIVDYLKTNKNVFLFQGTDKKSFFGEIVLTDKFRYVTGTRYDSFPKRQPINK